MFERSSAGEDARDIGLIRAIDASHARVGRAQRELLFLIAEVDRRGAWQDSGARDMAHWLAMRYGISGWKARRWIAAAHSLEALPHLAGALDRGELGIDKVVELARFAAPGTEAQLIRWAKDVSCGTIRHRGDLAIRASLEEVVDVERSRSVSWWYFDEGRRFGLEADLPAAQGAIVAQALERVARAIPAMPDEEEALFVSARRADALVALCSARIAADPDQDRASVVVHAQLDALMSDTGGSEIEDGPAIQPETVKRLMCNARIQTVLDDRAGNVLGLGRMSREPSAWMVRQIRYRDRGCQFPGCGTRAFTQAHHIVWWGRGGRTDLNNLLLICSFHHRVVHEHGWSVTRDDDGTVRWFGRDGTRYRAGPSPGVDAVDIVRADQHRLLAAVG
jgi:hypothetical protein